ncbi:MAG: ketoacyl-ACP synthase III [Nitrospirae bacterium]|nr:ketoacyl-ACP synthase III [Nitrospirota bacterium]
MTGSSAVYSKIIGTGSYIPERIVANKEIEDAILVGANGRSPLHWIRKRTGIITRHFAAPDEAASDLAVKAAINALKMAGVKAEEIDVIIVSTTSPDMPFPATACFVQHKLVARNAFAFDISASCAGFLYALSAGDQLIKGGMAERALIIASEVKSRFINSKSPDTYILFGDGAGAVALKKGIGARGKGQGIISMQMHTDGTFGNLIRLPAGGSRLKGSHKTVDENLHIIHMDGERVFKHAVKKLEESIMETLRLNRLNISDIELFILHQANLRILKRVSERLNIPSEKMFIKIDRVGNTSSASIPMALDSAVRENKIKKGSLIILAAFGGGLGWGSALIRW